MPVSPNSPSNPNHPNPDIPFEAPEPVKSSAKDPEPYLGFTPPTDDGRQPEHTPSGAGTKDTRIYERPGAKTVPGVQTTYSSSKNKPDDPSTHPPMFKEKK